MDEINRTTETANESDGDDKTTKEESGICDEVYNYFKVLPWRCHESR